MKVKAKALMVALSTWKTSKLRKMTPKMKTKNPRLRRQRYSSTMKRISAQTTQQPSPLKMQLQMLSPEPGL
jgi:hypothetical protein